MNFKQIDIHTYDAFAKVHPHQNFLNSKAALEAKSKEWEVEYVGLYQEEILVAATALVYIPTMRAFTYAYAQRGFLLDYSNNQLVSTFTQSIKQYLKKQKVSYLKIDPYVIYQTRDLNGEEIVDRQKNDTAIHNLTQNGFIHDGFTSGYNDYKQCRWMSSINIANQTKEKVFNSFEPRTKRDINTALKNKVKIKQLSYEELHILKEVVDATGDRRQFTQIPLSFYERQWHTYQENAKVYCAYIDLDEYITSIQLDIARQEEVKALATTRLETTPNSKKIINRINESNSMLVKLYKNIKEAKTLQKKHGKTLILAASLFIYYGEEVIYLTSGSYDEFKLFKGPYALQWHVIQEAIDLNYSIYNFYGISGYFTEDKEGYGVYYFKRGFKADVVELIGEFILPIHNVYYQILKKANKV